MASNQRRRTFSPQYCLNSHAKEQIPLHNYLDIINYQPNDRKFGVSSSKGVKDRAL